MFSEVESLDDSIHDIFVNGDWSLEKIKNDFGDTPTILTRVLKRRSCPVDVVKTLLKNGAEINCQDEEGYSPLMIALGVTNDEAIIRELLGGGADVNKVDRENRTPLLIFLQREDCSVRIVEVLLEFSADVNHKDKYGDSPLTTVIRKSEDDAVISALVERGAAVIDSINLANSPLIVLLREGKRCSVDTVKLLVAKLDYFNINSQSEQCDSPLVIALQNSRDEAVIKALLENGADCNMIVDKYNTPLVLYLSNDFTSNCSSGIVKLLLSFNADLNIKEVHSPLSTALENKKDKVIIKMLLESGADVNTLHYTGQSPLCIAFRKYSNHDVAKLLLDAGSPLNLCRYHKNPLHCALDCSNSGLSEDILRLFLEANSDVNFIDNHGQSVMCYALQHGAKAKDIQLLLNAGASLNSCFNHSSPLICATRVYHSAPLRGEVLKLLLDNGASADGEDLNIIQGALYFSAYDTRAIQLLLDLPGMDAYVAENKLLLNHALLNENCRPNVVKLLIDRKVQVLAGDEWGFTSLHSAALNRKCDPNVIKLLLENGSPVNAKNHRDLTPLAIAVTKNLKSNVLKELLLAGAHIKNKMFYFRFGKKGLGLLDLLVQEWQNSRSGTLHFEMLAKFFLLRNPEFDITNFQRTFKNYCLSELLIFFNKCLNELEKMNSLQVSNGHTFRMFVARDCLSAEENYDFDKILMHLTKNSYPVFFDIISARIGRSIMEAEVKKLQVYTNKIGSMEQVNLNSDIAYIISEYLLFDEDLLNFILAFYKPVRKNQTIKYGSFLGKRNSEQSTECHKHPKL